MKGFGPFFLYLSTPWTYSDQPLDTLQPPMDGLCRVFRLEDRYCPLDSQVGHPQNIGGLGRQPHGHILTDHLTSTTPQILGVYYQPPGQGADFTGPGTSEPSTLRVDRIKGNFGGQNLSDLFCQGHILSGGTWLYKPRTTRVLEVSVWTFTVRHLLW